MNASLNKELRAVKWGEFKITQLFKPITVRRKIKSEDVEEEGIYPAYSSDSENSGIIGYYSEPEFICDSNNPVYVVFGDHTRTMSIVRKSFSVLDNVKVLRPHIENTNVLLFIFSVWKKQIPNLGYKRHWGIAKECRLRLPVKNNKIDFDFMESFIAELEAVRVAELEAERVAELSAYLTVSGLDNYELSNDEMTIIERYKKQQIPFSEFEFIKIFNNIKQGRRLKKDDQLPGNIPFVMSGTTNTGVVGYISNPVAQFPKNSITIDIFGNSFFRNYDFGAGDDTGVYWNTEIEYSKTCMLFFAAAMERALRGKYSYGKKLRSSQSVHFKMQLPTKDGKPDYDTMATLISAVQKLVIKDVVLYADRKIETTKAITKH